MRDLRVVAVPGQRMRPTTDDSVGPAQRQQPHLLRDEADGRVYVVTAYTEKPDGTLDPVESADVTTDFERLLVSTRATYGPAVLGLASRLYDLAHDRSPGSTRRTRLAAMADLLGRTLTRLSRP